MNVKPPSDLALPVLEPIFTQSLPYNHPDPLVALGAFEGVIKMPLVPAVWAFPSYGGQPGTYRQQASDQTSEKRPRHAQARPLPATFLL